MKKTIASLFGSINVAAIIAASAPLALTLPSAPAMAQASVSMHCVSAVRHSAVPAIPGSGGINPMFGGVYSMLNQATGPVTKLVTAPTVTGPTGLGQVCQNEAKANYIANKGWSDPAQYCARTPDGKKHKVEILAILTEIGGPFIGHVGGYNLVAGYTVTCAGPINVTPLTVPVVVP